MLMYLNVELNTDLYIILCHVFVCMCVYICMYRYISLCLSERIYSKMLTVVISGG